MLTEIDEATSKLMGGLMSLEAGFEQSSY